jgi:hypothetical protein
VTVVPILDSILVFIFDDCFSTAFWNCITRGAHGTSGVREARGAREAREAREARGEERMTKPE